MHYANRSLRPRDKILCHAMYNFECEHERIMIYLERNLMVLHVAIYMAIKFYVCTRYLSLYWLLLKHNVGWHYGIQAFGVQQHTLQ